MLGHIVRGCAMVLVAVWMLSSLSYWSGVSGAGGMPESGFGGIELIYVHIPTWLVLYLPSFVWFVVLAADALATHSAAADDTPPKEADVSARNSNIAGLWLAALAMFWAASVLVGQVAIVASREQETSVWESARAKVSRDPITKVVNSVRFSGSRKKWNVGVLRTSWASHVRRVSFSADAEDQDFAHLKDLPRLETVNAENSAIGDRGIEMLAGHPVLASLHLANTRITDQSVISFKQIPRLSTLDVRSTAMSPSAVQELKGVGISVESGTRLPPATHGPLDPS
jgi:hypothetical protein